MITVSSKITENDLKEFRSTLNYYPNKLFDEIESIDDKLNFIKLSSELKEIMKGHISRDGNLMFSSFLPHNISVEYCKYITAKHLNTVINNGVNEISQNINNKILKELGYE